MMLWQRRKKGANVGKCEWLSRGACKSEEASIRGDGHTFSEEVADTFQVPRSWTHVYHAHENSKKHLVLRLRIQIA